MLSNARNVSCSCIHGNCSHRKITNHASTKSSILCVWVFVWGSVGTSAKSVCSFCLPLIRFVGAGFGVPFGGDSGTAGELGGAALVFAALLWAGFFGDALLFAAERCCFAASFAFTKVLSTSSGEALDLIMGCRGSVTSGNQMSWLGKRLSNYVPSNCLCLIFGHRCFLRYLGLFVDLLSNKMNVCNIFSG